MDTVRLDPAASPGPAAAAAVDLLRLLKPGETVSARVLGAVGAGPEGTMYALAFRGQTLVAQSAAELAPDSVVKLLVAQQTGQDGAPLLKLLAATATGSGAAAAPSQTAAQMLATPLRLAELGLAQTDALAAQVLDAFAEAEAPMAPARLQAAVAAARQAPAAQAPRVARAHAELARAGLPATPALVALAERAVSELLPNSGAALRTAQQALASAPEIPKAEEGTSAAEDAPAPAARPAPSRPPVSTPAMSAPAGPIRRESAAVPEPQPASRPPSSPPGTPAAPPAPAAPRMVATGPSAPAASAAPASPRAEAASRAIAVPVAAEAAPAAAPPRTAPPSLLPRSAPMEAATAPSRQVAAAAPAPLGGPGAPSQPPSPAGVPAPAPAAPGAGTPLAPSSMQAADGRPVPAGAQPPPVQPSAAWKASAVPAEAAAPAAPGPRPQALVQEPARRPMPIAPLRPAAGATVDVRAALEALRTLDLPDAERGGLPAVLAALRLAGVRAIATGETAATALAAPAERQDGPAAEALHRQIGRAGAAMAALPPALAPIPAAAGAPPTESPPVLAAQVPAALAQAAREQLADQVFRPRDLVDYDRVVPLPLQAQGQPTPARLAVATRSMAGGQRAAFLRVDAELSELGQVSMRLSGVEGGPLAITLIAPGAGAGHLAAALPALAADLRALNIDAAIRVVETGEDGA